jgi:3-isopropylmalate/(R)-2-methylmalate dehydratase small subunit
VLHAPFEYFSETLNMEKFTAQPGLVAPFDRDNVDTDAICPKQFLTSIKRTGFGPNLFDGWRYLDDGGVDGHNVLRPLNPTFFLNQPRYQGASILLARRNFGCGSSREHAVWAIQQYGFRAVIAVSFADIFYNNCFKNGLLPITLGQQEIEDLFAQVSDKEGYQLKIDLETKTISSISGDVWEFEIDDFRRRCLLDGLDEIDLTMRQADRIRSFEGRHHSSQPWLGTDIPYAHD